jgi:hypothetical protein
MQRAGSSKSAVDWRRFSSQRMLSLPSIGTRVGLFFFLRAAVPLNFSRVQNLTAARPKGTPSVVTAKLERIRSQQTVCIRKRPSLPLAAVDAIGEPDPRRPLPLVGKLGGVLEHQDRPLRRRKTLARRVEMAGQDLRFADPLIGKSGRRPWCSPNPGRPKECSPPWRRPYAAPKHGGRE